MMLVNFLVKFQGTPATLKRLPHTFFVVVGLLLMFYLTINPRTYRFFEDYVQSLVSRFPFTIIAIQDLAKLVWKPEDVIIFLRQIPQDLPATFLDDKCHYLINTEQCTRSWILANLVSNTRSDTHFLDYSLGNLVLLQERYPKLSFQYLPYQLNPAEDRRLIKDYGVVMVGTNSPRREAIAKQLLDSIASSHVITDSYGKDRDDLLFRHKILVNVHYAEDYWVFEQMRCIRCLVNHMIIITERSVDPSYELEEYMIFCDYGELMAKTQEVLRNYDTYYQQLFANFDLQHLQQRYQPLEEIFSRKHHVPLETP